MLLFLFAFFAAYKLKTPFQDVLLAPMSMYMIAFLLMVQPLNRMHKNTRFSLLHMLKRVIRPGIQLYKYIYIYILYLF